MDHMLTLLEEAPYSEGIYNCSLCQLPGNGPVHHCNICEFNLHPGCAATSEKETHFLHFRHPLHLQRGATNICNACGVSVGPSESYCCHVCDFNLHPGCVRTPKYLKHPSHGHVLELVTPTACIQALSMPSSMSAFMQAISTQTASSSSTSSSMSASMSSSTSALMAALSMWTPSSSSMSSSRLPSMSMPMPSSTSAVNQALSRRTLLSSSTSSSSSPTSYMSSSISASMSSSTSALMPALSIQKSPSSSTSAATSAACLACDAELKGPAYLCRGACGEGVGLHLPCARLPSRPLSPLHPGNHRLNLLFQHPYANGNFICGACGKHGAKWAYHCPTCRFDLHTNCAHIPHHTPSSSSSNWAPLPATSASNQHPPPSPSQLVYVQETGKAQLPATEQDLRLIIRGLLGARLDPSPQSTPTPPGIPPEPEDTCCTCLEGYTDDTPKEILQCGHHFHIACIITWYEMNSTCPICRQEIVFQ